MALFFRREALTGFLFLFLAATALAGCASIDWTDYRQTVLVTSNPPGAAIYEGNLLLGVAPAFVRVRRKLHPKLTVTFKNQDKRSVTLKTHYRWLDSFGYDFFFLTGAPLAWGIDFLTGNSWRMDDPEPFEFQGSERYVKVKNNKVIAVAPPLTSDRENADAMGPLLEGKLREGFPEAQVLPYDKTAPVFGYYDSDQGLTERKTTRYNLYRELKADEIYVSKAEPEAQGYHVSGSLRDVFTEKAIGPYAWDISPGQGELRDSFEYQRFLDRNFHFLPNTVFINFADFNSSVHINGQTYQGKSARGQGLTDEILNYVSSFGLEHLDRPRDKVKGHFVLDFIPNLVASDKHIIYTSYAPISNIPFNRLYLAAGYGLEVGHQSRYGLFYLDFVPQLTWTQIKFSTEAFDDTLSRFSVQQDIEFGWTYFLTSHLVVKIYTRSLNEDNALWERAIHDSSGRDESVSSTQSIFQGIAFGYYLPISLRKREGWKVIEHPEIQRR